MHRKKYLLICACLLAAVATQPVAAMRSGQDTKPHTNTIGMKMVPVAPESFVMGADNTPLNVEKTDLPAAGPDRGRIEPIEAPFDMSMIKRPVFPDGTFDIRDFGAVEGGIEKATGAINLAIERCSAQGGGRVLVPEGVWLTGAIILKSNVNLFLAKGSILKFSTDFEDYLPVVFSRVEGLECYNYRPLIYARDCTNIALTGSGELDGQGQAWWHLVDEHIKAVEKLYKMARDGIPPDKRIFGTLDAPLRPAFIEPVNCTNVLIEGVTIGSGPFWTLHPVYCRNVIVRGITIDNTGPNNDGVTPDSCDGVLVENCSFLTRDDTVTLKSGLNEDGWRVGRPCENVVVRHCEFRGEGMRRGGMVIGSEMSGGIKNVLVHDCSFDGADRAVRIKSMPGRGGYVENVWVRDITARNLTKQAITINMFYADSTVPPVSDKAPVFRNIFIRNLECNGASEAIRIAGLPESPIENVTLENISIMAEQGMICFNARNITMTNVDIESEDQAEPVAVQSRGTN